MKLSVWAKQQGITYKTAWKWVRNDTMPCPFEILPTGTIIVHPNQPPKSSPSNVFIYGRVSTTKQKDDLVRQIHRCNDFAAAKGLSIDKTFSEIASGMNDKRPQLTKMLNMQPSIIIVEHKDRLTRFGFNYIELLLKQQNCEILVINKEDQDENDLMADMISIVTSFCCRLYGKRRGKNTSDKIKELVM
jgi:predicted site-specific integrase-resolvase